MYKHLLITTYNAYIKDELSKLPIMSTIDEYITNIQNYFLDDAKKDYDRIPTTYDIIKGCIISEKYDNICFDIFDTLVWRPFNKPTDLFYLIAKDVSNILSNERFDFYSARISAEWHARRKSANLGYEDVTLEDIYTSFSTLFNIPQEICKEIADIEKKYELKFIQCRKSTKNLVELALNCNKKVYAVSDMYMSSAFLSKILEKAGYNSFNRIIVSSEYKALKSTGRLFDILNKDLNIKPSKSIFIGDNINSDVLKPMEIGYRVFHYQSALQCFKTKTLFPPFFNTTLTHCIATYLAVIANIIFDNPYLKFDKKTMFNNSQYLVGFIALGPILLNFTSWLIKNIENKNYKILLFSSRDCYFIEKIYKLVKKYYPKQLPTSKYFYISRKATLPCFQDKLNKALLVDKYSSNYSAIEFLNEYFSVDKDSDLIIKNKTYLKKIKNNIIEKTKLQEFIVENEIINDIDIKRKQDMLKNYTLQETQGEEFAIIDSGARGTSRDALSDLLQREIDLYLFRSYRYKFSDKNLTFSYHKESFNYFRSGRAAFTSAFYEPLISCAHEGSCTGYEKLKTKIIPVIDKLENTESQQYIFFVQRGILDFSEKYITIFKNNTVDTIFEPSVEIFKAPLEFVHARMSDAKLFEKFVHYDQLSGFIGNSRILMPPLQISQNSINVKNNNEQNEKCNQQKNIKISSHIKLKKKILLYLEKIICSCLLNGRKHDKYLHNRNMFFIDSKKKILHLWYNYINNI